MAMEETMQQTTFKEQCKYLGWNENTRGKIVERRILMANSLENSSGSGGFIGFWCGEKFVISFMGYL